ncbi:gliding motility-associated C-terminal domain-containing protein [Terrimonas sp. NA20]|uniref:Gliding motility-associated C-terminal domain-containing protein n=1 Tax=Terrimonas ginsenosidimutans TaxID=2908004 RepID=A0ABS9KXM5_9BACT|nr:gliding motility-associated C-terminal domain-containing protein [Terrimonas ginsenosidimutans]MCG2617058.1 gliding motility-associated C-terminal domain-containing protein [Terrimonas ginsenosidimutans]
MTRILPILLLGLLLNLTPSRAQTLQPDFGAPAVPVNVCNGNAVFKVRVVGGSSACTQGTLTISLPAGYAYFAGSATLSAGSGSVTETSVSGNTATLTIQSVPAAPGFTEISYQAYANCAVLSAGTAVNNQAAYSFSSPCGPSTTVTSNSFNTRSASLTITNITNTSYFGAAGDNYTRTITITNNGLGSISRVNLTDTSGSGLSIKGISVSGGWTFLTSKQTFGSDTLTNFTLIGGELAQGQSITLIENVTMVSNCNLQSRFATWFGCDGVPCMTNNVSGKATAGATVNNSYVPSLKLIPELLALQCRGTDYAQVLKLTNTGSVRLNDLSLNLFSTASQQPAALQHFNAGAPVSSQSAFTAFQFKVGVNGSWAALTSTSAANFSTPAACFGASSSNLTFNIPVINPGDTIFIRYTEKNCPVGVAVNGPLVAAGTLLRYDYEAPCGGRTEAVSSLLRNPVSTEIVPEASLPATMVPGQSYTFTYRFPVAQAGLYTSTGADASSIRFELQLPAKIHFSGNAADIQLRHPVTGNALATGSSFSYNTGTNQVQISYTVTPGFPLNTLHNAVLTFNNMILDCNTAGAGNTVTLSSFLKSTASCPAEESLFATTSSISFACPQPACDVRGGLSFADFSLQRTNVGFADNDNNGIAEAGVPDPSRIRRGLAMPGDTIVAVFNGAITGGSSSPSFQYAYAVDTFTTGSTYLSNLYARVEIFAWGQSTPFYIANNVPIQGTGTTRRVDASISTLDAITPMMPGYGEYLDGDSVVIYMYYKVTGNPGSRYFPVEVKNGFYLSDIPNPSSPADHYTCGNNIQGQITLVGYETGSGGNQTYTSVGNGNVVTSMDHYLSIGGAAAGSKPFINEFRPVSVYNELRYTVPANYDYVAATVTYYYTTGVGTSASLTVPVTPVSASANPLVFNAGNLFQNGTLPAGDQGHRLVLNVTIKPGCEAPASSEALFFMSQIATPGFNTGFAPASYNGKDSIFLIAPEIIASTANTTPTSNDATISWEIQISNPTIAQATRVWMGKASGAGITITSIQRLSGPGGFVTTTLSPTGAGIYQLGTLNQASNYYRINATYTSCEKDSMQLAYWYDCAGVGYPANVASAVYKKEMKLSVIPLHPALQTSIITEPAGSTHDFCDVLTYEIETINTGSSAVHGLTVTAFLPASGTTYVPGSYRLEYPAGSGSYISIPDAQVNVGANSIVFTIPSSEIAQLISTEGFRIRFGLTTACGFGSGGSFRFMSTGSSFCGTVTSATQQQSQKITINGIPQYTNVYSVSSVTTTGQLDCTTGDIVATYKFKIINQGPLPTTIADGFRVTLPSPWQMDAASISFTHDPAGASYTGLTGGYYNFLMGAGVAAGDSVVFTATVRVPATAAPTYPTGSSSTITEEAVIRYGGVCSQTGVTCPITEVVVASQNTSTFNYAGGQTGTPVVVITNPAPVCAPATVDITLAGITTGSTAGLTFTYFTDAAGTAVLANPSAISMSGTYYIRGTSVGGCFDIKPVTVVINPQPLANISYSGSPFCGGNTAAVTQSGQTGGSFSSTTGLSIDAATGTINIAGSTPGTYIVTYSFTNGTCTNTASTTVVINALPVASISYAGSPFCVAGSATLIVPVTRTGHSGGIYSAGPGLSIDPATGAVNVGASTAGTYTITYSFTNGTCSNTAITTIVIGATMNLVVTNPAPVCAPGTVDITAAAVTAGSDAGLTFQYYTDAAGTAVLTNPSAIAASGTYYIQGTSSGGCKTPVRPVNVVITPAPVASIVYNGAPFCVTGTASVTQTGLTGGTYSSTAGLSINPSTGAINLGGSTPGTYTITYTVSNGTCSNTTTTTITIIAAPALVTHNPAPVCAPATADLTLAAVTVGSTPGLSFNYYTNAAGTTALPNPNAVSVSGTYYIQGYSASGCLTSIVPVVVTIVPAPVASINYPGSPYCQGTASTGTVTQTGQTGGTYSASGSLSIHPSTGAINIAASTPGTYTVTYTFSNGTCSNTTTTQVTIVSAPVLVINNPAPVCAPSSVDLTDPAITAGSTSGLSFSYYTNASGTTALTNPSAVSASGTYYIQGSTPGGCVTTIGAVNVVINPLPVATISYTGSPFCNTGNAVVTQTGQTGGSYSSGAGLIIDPVTGTIDLGASTPGSYTITYSFSNGTCSRTTTANIVIATPPVLVITDPAPVCAPATVNLTAASITAGSASGLTYAYFTDATATTPLTNPSAVAAGGTYYIEATNAGGCKTIRPVQVTVHPAPVASISYTGSPFCTAGTATVSQTGQAGGSYTSSAGLSIDPVTGTINITTSTAGTYTVTYSFSNGTCSSTATTSVVIASIPTLVIHNPAVVCAPLTVDLTHADVTAGSTPGLSFNYYTDAAGTIALGNPNAVNAGGTYYIQGVTPAGCRSSIQAVTVTINPLPVANISYNGSPYCAAQGPTASVTQTGQTGGIYGSTTGLVINATTGAIDLIASTPGTYTVTYTFSNGICSATANATVTISPLPVLIITNPAAVCAPGTVDITAPGITTNSTPGLTYNYFIDPGGLIKLSSPNAIGTSGTYYVQGTTAAGCVTDIEAVVVTVNLTPTAAIAYNSAPFCVSAGGTGTVTRTGLAGGTYSSSPSGLSMNSTTGAINVSASTPGTYTITYSFNNGLCSNTTSTDVNIMPAPVLVVTNPVPACIPATVDLTAAAITAGSTAGLTYQYFSDAACTTPLTNASAITASGTYYIRALNTASGCQTDARAVNVVISATPTISIANVAAICRGEAVTLSASSPGNTITWQNIGAGNSVIVYPQSTTTYTAVATNAAGCSVSATVQVQVRDFKMSLTANTNPIMPGMLLTLTSGANSSYNVIGWKPEANFSAQTAIAQSLIIKDSSQTFAVIGRSADGCLDTARLLVELEPGGKDFFIPNAFTPNNDGKNDTFKPYGSSIKSIEMRVFNQWGELVYQTTDVNKGWDGIYKGKAQPVGVYPYGVKVTFLDNTTVTKRGTVNLVR